MTAIDQTELAARVEAFLDSQTPPVIPETRGWYLEGKELSAMLPELFIQALRVGTIGAQINALLALRENGYEVWDVCDDPLHSIYSVKTPDGAEFMIEPEQHPTYWPSIVPPPRR